MRIGKTHFMSISSDVYKRQVDYCPVSELMEYHKDIKNEEVDALVATYFKEYDLSLIHI